MMCCGNVTGWRMTGLMRPIRRDDLLQTPSPSPAKSVTDGGFELVRDDGAWHDPFFLQSATHYI
jgi:hypothetical protein